MRFRLVVLVVLAAVFLAGCEDGGSTGSAQQAPEPVREGILLQREDAVAFAALCSQLADPEQGPACAEAVGQAAEDPSIQAEADKLVPLVIEEDGLLKLEGPDGDNYAVEKGH